MANDKKKKLTRVDKLEERVAPAMMGGMVMDGSGIELDGGDSFEKGGDSFEKGGDVDADQKDGGSGDDTNPFEKGGDDGLGGDADVGGEAPSIYGSDAVMNEDGSVTFGAPEGYQFDEYGILDIPADEAGNAFAAYPPGVSMDADGNLMQDGNPYEGKAADGFFPPGSSIAADGSYHFESPEPFNVGGDGSSITIDTDGDADFKSDGDTGENTFEKAPAEFGDDAVMNDDGSVTFKAPEGYEFEKDGTLHIPAGETDGVIADYPNGTSFDLDNGLTVDGEAYDGDVKEGYFPPGSSLDGEGNYDYAPPADFTINEDGSMKLEAPTVDDGGEAPYEDTNVKSEPVQDTNPFEKGGTEAPAPEPTDSGDANVKSEPVQDTNPFEKGGK